MSDAAKNVGIEDVLASIRRLVSEEGDQAESPRDPVASRFAMRFDTAGQKSLADAEAPANIMSEAPVTDDALVLTPALRVDDAKTRGADLTAALQEHGTSPDDMHDGSERREPASREEPEGPIDLSAFIAPGPAEDAPLDRPDVVTSVTLRKTMSHEADASPARESGRADEEPLPLVQVLAAVPDLSQRPEPVSDAVDAIRHPVPVDGDLAQGSRSPEENDAEEAIAVPEARTARTDPDTVEDDAASLEEKIARLEALVQRSRDAMGPDQAGIRADRTDGARAEHPGSDPGFEAADPRDIDNATPVSARPAWETDGALTAVQLESLAVDREITPGQEASDKPATSLMDKPTAEPRGEMVVDDDVLRELVAVLVREELRGPLGEKITRNVRNLVRREIHRTLASRELD